jgi:hypothetical protein
VPEDGGQARRRRAAHRRQWDALGHPHSRGTSTRRIREVERRRAWHLYCSWKRKRAQNVWSDVQKIFDFWMNGSATCIILQS